MAGAKKKDPDKIVETDISEISNVTLEDSEYVDNIINNSGTLKRYLNLKYEAEELAAEADALYPEAIKEYQELFSNAQLAKGTLVKLNLKYKASKWEFSQAVESLEKTLAMVKDTEKTHGIAKKTETMEKSLAVSFNKEAIKATQNKSEAEAA